MTAIEEAWPSILKKSISDQPKISQVSTKIMGQFSHIVPETLFLIPWHDYIVSLNCDALGQVPGFINR